MSHLNTDDLHREHWRQEVRRRARKHGTRLGRRFADDWIETVLKGYHPVSDLLPPIHVVFRNNWPNMDRTSFRRACLATLRRKGRSFIAQERNDAATVAATLWYAFKHRQTPTAHDLFELFADWQRNAYRRTKKPSDSNSQSKRP